MLPSTIAAGKRSKGCKDRRRCIHSCTNLTGRLKSQREHPRHLQAGKDGGVLRTKHNLSVCCTHVVASPLATNIGFCFFTCTLLKHSTSLPQVCCRSPRVSEYVEDYRPTRHYSDEGRAGAIQVISKQVTSEVPRLRGSSEGNEGSLVRYEWQAQCPAL